VKAEQSWNAASPSMVERCVAVLEESARELQAVRASATQLELSGLTSELLRMKSAATRLERLSDLAAAFLRGDAVTTGASPLYRHDGFAEASASAPTLSTRIQA